MGLRNWLSRPKSKPELGEVRRVEGVVFELITIDCHFDFGRSQIMLTYQVKDGSRCSEVGNVIEMPGPKVV